MLRRQWQTCTTLDIGMVEDFLPSCDCSLEGGLQCRKNMQGLSRHQATKHEEL